jgi:hypothetical protein
MTFSERAVEAAKKAAPRFWRDTVNFDKHMAKCLTAALAVDGLALQGWRTIDSAPKDGTWFLGLAERDMSPYRISWGRNHRDELGWCTSFSSFTGGYITHWSPWPPLTAASDGEVG